MTPRRRVLLRIAAVLLALAGTVVLLFGPTMGDGPDDVVALAVSLVVGGGLLYAGFAVGQVAGRS